MSVLYVDNLQPNLGSRVMAAGHVVQVKQASSNSRFTTQSTSFVDTGFFSLSFDHDIALTSKVLVQIEATIGEINSTLWARPVVLTVYEDSTNIGDDLFSGIASSHPVNENATQNIYLMQKLTGSILYTPTATSPVYTFRVRSTAAFTRSIGGAYDPNSAWQTGGTRLTIMEIAQ